MGKTRNTGKLATQIQFDNSNNLVIGNSTSSSFNTSGSVNAIGGITGSIFGIGDPTSFSASISSDLVNLESKSASVDISISNINSFTASNGNTSLNAATSSYSKLTGGNTFTGTQIVSASVYIQGDLVVQGSSSIQYISASSVSIGTNIVQLNTATPAVRYAGLTVQDSGSAAGVTGSILWDSCCNKWIYSNPSGVGYSGGMLISGPRNTGSIGNEVGLTCNYLATSIGSDHISSSAIYHDSSVTCIPNSLVVGTNNAYAIYLRDSAGNAKPVIASAGSTNLNFYNICSTGKININNAADNSVLMSIDNCGSVTHNSTSYNVAYFNSTYGQSNINIQNNGTTIAVFGSGASATSTAGGNDVGIGTAGLNNSIVLATGTGFVERMRITCTGLIGIGASPLTATAAVLQVEQASGNMFALRRADCSNTGNSRILFQAYNASGIVQNTGIVEAGLDSSATNGYIGFYAGTAAMNMKITSTGLIGMNQLSPTYRLEICSPASDCVLGLMSANGVNIDMVGYGTTLTYPQARVQMNDDGFYGGNLSLFTKPNGAAGNGLLERMRITSCGKVGIGASSPRWLLEICANNACGGGGQYPAVVVNNGCTTGYSALYFYNGLAQMGGMETSNLTCNILINSALGSLNLQTIGVNRLTLNSAGGFGTQLCNFSMNGTYQTLVTVENGSYGLMMLSSCLGGGTYALYNVFNNAGTTTANLIHGNNIPVQISGNAVQVRSSNSATYCDMRSSYIRFY